MEGTYTIWLSQEAVGSVTVERSGLYYLFRCQCQLHSQVICRVMVSCGGRIENLGILIPGEKSFHLTKKLPIREFPPGVPEFWITPRHLTKREISVDIYPEEPFHYISKLENAYLRTKQGMPVLVIKDPTL